MSKSDLETTRKKLNEEYEKHMKEYSFQSEIDGIAKDIRDRQDNAMAMEFTQKIGKLLRENGVVLHVSKYISDIESTCNPIENKTSYEQKYGVVFDGLDFMEHDRSFKTEIAQLKNDLNEMELKCHAVNKITEKYNMNFIGSADIQLTYDEKEYSLRKLVKSFETAKDISEENKYLKEQITQLQSELSMKENLLKIKNSADEYRDALGFACYSDPMSVAKQLIDAHYERKLNDLEKAMRKVTGCDCETTVENVYSVSELRQIAEHLLVYCNYNPNNEEI